MIRVVLFTFVVASAPAALAQSAQPRELMVAPSAPNQPPEAVRPGGQVQSSGAPANICEELLAYLRQAPSRASDGTSKAPSTTGGPGQSAPPVDQAQQRSGQSAPIPRDDDAKARSIAGPPIETAQALLTSNDLHGCQDAVRHMRRAGAALPPGLLALAALRDDLLISATAPAR
jgi:hypothetical protein